MEYILSNLISLHIFGKNDEFNPQKEERKRERERKKEESSRTRNAFE